MPPSDSGPPPPTSTDKLPLRAPCPAPPPRPDRRTAGPRAAEGRSARVCRYRSGASARGVRFRAAFITPFMSWRHMMSRRDPPVLHPGVDLPHLVLEHLCLPRCLPRHRLSLRRRRRPGAGSPSRCSARRMWSGSRTTSPSPVAGHVLDSTTLSPPDVSPRARSRATRGAPKLPQRAARISSPSLIASSAASFEVLHTSASWSGCSPNSSIMCAAGRLRVVSSPAPASSGEEDARPPRTVPFWPRTGPADPQLISRGSCSACAAASPSSGERAPSATRRATPARRSRLARTPGLSCALCSRRHSLLDPGTGL